MIWQYLSQFWDSIVAVSEYPVEFFQNIGNAVAGALGDFLDIIFHNLNDIFVIINWLGVNFKNIFVSLSSPLTYFFNILRFFFSTAFSTPPNPEITFTFSQRVLDVFEAIPHWQVLSSVLGAGVILIIGVSGLKLLLRS